MKLLLPCCLLLLGCHVNQPEMSEPMPSKSQSLHGIARNPPKITKGNLHGQWQSIQTVEAYQCLKPRIIGGDTSIDENRYVFDVYGKENQLLQTITVTPFVDIFPEIYIKSLLGKNHTQLHVVNVHNW